MKRQFALVGVLVVLAALILGRGLVPAGTAHGTGTSMFGNGSDGAVTFSADTTFFPPEYAEVNSGSAGGTTLTVSSLAGVDGTFQVGKKILIHQTRGGTALLGQPNWEINEVQNYAAGNIITTTPLANTYSTSGASAAQVLVVPQYTDVTVNAGVTLSAKAWSGATGGVLAFLASGTVTATGTIAANSKGYRGAGGGSTQQLTGRQGEGIPGAAYSRTTSANGNGGGGGAGGGGDCSLAAGAGGGGGNGTAGVTGTTSNGGPGGTGGSISGAADLTTMTFGGSGGEGGSRNNSDTVGATEGNGGGIIFAIVRTITATGSIVANGQDAVSGGSPYGEGGGAGGSILLKSQTATLGTTLLTATGGAGSSGSSSCGSGAAGGAGGVGRIRLEYCGAFPSGGITNPPASLQQISCKTPPTQLNITNLGQYALPKTCFEVRNASQVALFTVCDNDFAGPPETDAVCDPDTTAACEDADPDPGEISVALDPGDYRVVISQLPPFHLTPNTKQTCNTTGGACALTFVSVPGNRPWFPWDVEGPNHSPITDGYVDLANDILGVAFHYQACKPPGPSC